jgi:hypothetical protein
LRSTLGIEDHMMLEVCEALEPPHTPYQTPILNALFGSATSTLEMLRANRVSNKPHAEFPEARPICFLRSGT